MAGVSWARELAARYLAESLPRRWSHVQGVAVRARAIGDVVQGEHDVLVSAAWLHDLGYAAELSDTGFHPLDGARYLRRLGADDRLCGLVAHHSAALVEAHLRGLVDQLNDEFPREQSPVSDALWCADLTVGPDGDSVAASSGWPRSSSATAPVTSYPQLSKGRGQSCSQPSGELSSDSDSCVSRHHAPARSPMRR